MNAFRNFSNPLFTLILLSFIVSACEKETVIIPGQAPTYTIEDVVVHVQNGCVLEVIKHPNKNRYPHQNMIVLDVEGYVYLVPYIKSRGVRFLKTIIPSRKATREYLS